MKYSQEIADAICELLADGISLHAICRQENMPGRSTVYRWLNENEAFRDQYARAREWQAETMADEIVQLADDADTTDAQTMAKARLQVEARKWTAAKLLPKKYGDRIQQDVSVSGEVPMKLILPPDAGEGS